MRLDSRLRERALGLEEREWRTELFEAMVEAVGACRAGDPEPLRQVTEETEELIDLLWEVYSNTPVVEGEVTAETVVGHGLLRDGMQAWLDALALASQGDLDGALAVAEEANRLLAVLRQFSAGLT